MAARVLIAALVLCLAACASRSRAPVEDRSTRATAPAPPAAAAAEPETRVQTYTVKRGDTLYAIALDHGLDYRELAAWNNIENINVIRVGQVLRVAPPGDTGSAAADASGVQTMPLRSVAPVQPSDASGTPPGAAVAASTPPAPAATSPATAVAGARNTESYKTQPKAIKEPYSEQALREVQRGADAPTTIAAASPPAALPAVVPPPAAVASVEPKAEAKPAAPAADDSQPLDWVWPAKGKIVAGFSETASLKGIDIAGTAGQPVTASAAGKVVYAGTGLRGYGKLIIIKHNGTYLSAYAHNREILVKEGQQVAKGQKVAEMGNTDAEQVMLHFEIRRQGKPVDPLKYLPPA